MTTFVRTAYHQQKMLELEKEITRLRQRDNEKDAERYRYLRQIDRCWSWNEKLRQRVAELEAERTKQANPEAIRALQRAIADNEKDAERYRYLRQIDRCWSWEGLLQLPDDSILRTEDIDAAIDAAMADPDDDFTRGEHDL